MNAVTAAMPMPRNPLAYAKPVIWLLALSPLAWLALTAQQQGLGPNPAEYLNRFLGDWALRMLFVALAITPVRKLTGWTDVARFRRLIGLFAFFYVALHVTSYVVLDQFLDWAAIWADVVKRTYITLGMVAFVILAAMAATSTTGMMKRMGGRNWRRLHKGVYAAGILACGHFFMMRKGLQLEPMIYGAILAMLLGARLLPNRKRAHSTRT